MCERLLGRRLPAEQPDAVTNRIMNIERLRQLGYQGLRRLGYSFYEIDSLFEVLERQE